MKIELIKLYNYVFGDWSNLRKYVKTDLPHEHKEKLIEKRTKAIRDLFANYKFAIRSVVREHKNSHLEQILFNNDTDEIPFHLKYPDKKIVNLELDSLEKKYSLLSSEKQKMSEQTRKMFYEYFKISKLIADVFEKNNDVYNALAYIHAYKLLVIFGDSANLFLANVDKYLESHNFLNISDEPLHDALIYNLPEVRNDKINLDAWRKLIFEEGSKVLKLFNMALAIEKQLGGRPPKDLQEAREAAQHIQFKNAKKFPELAGLFIEYSLDEALFEQTLQIEKYRKKRDNLPDVMISGSDISPKYSSYHFVKLPIDDPHAYVLGHITNCCQSIGGHSEICVVDGVTRENNGFYVLLKSKSKVVDNKAEYKENFNPINQGKINYRHYDIVGQGYAWLSQQGNLVFDSWENKNLKRDNQIVAHFLEQFSKNITLQKDSSIVRVMIGRGGNTPAQLTTCTVTHPEAMKEGAQYVDSTYQSMIYCNTIARDSFIADIDLEMKKNMNSENQYELNKLFHWMTESIYSKDLASFTKSFLTTENIKFLLRMEEIQAVSWDILFHLVQADMLTKENVLTITHENKCRSRELCHALVKIKNAGYDMNHSIRKLLEESYKPDVETFVILQKLTILKEAKLHQDFEIQRKFLKETRDLNRNKTKEYVNDLVNAFTLLKHANLDQDATIRKSIYRCEEFCAENRARNIISANDLIVKNNIDDKLRITILASRYPLCRVEAYLKLKQVGFENQLDIRAKLFKGYAEETYTKDIIRAFTLLKDAKLDHDINHRQSILNYAPYQAEDKAKEIIATVGLFRR